MGFRILRRPRRAGLLVSGSLLVASLYYLSASPGTQNPSQTNAHAEAHGAPASVPASVPVPAQKKPAAVPDPHQKPVLDLELPPLGYGLNARPPFKELNTLVTDLPPEHVPVLDSQASGSFTWRGFKHPARRLIIIGDVHGQLSALQELLAKTGFDREKGDHLILTGDLVNKGPDSSGVVQLAMDLGASAVRGNHDDRLLLVNKEMNRPNAASRASESGHSKIHTYHGSESGGGFLAGWFGSGDKKDAFTVTELDDGDRKGMTKWEGENGEPSPEWQASHNKNIKPGKLSRHASRGDEAWRLLAETMTEKQLAWLAGLPTILRVGHLPGSSAPWNSEIVVVHAGLVPALALEKQSPWAVTHMRSLTFPAEGMRRDEVRKYLRKVAKQRNRGRAMPVTEAEVDRELKRLHRELPADTWEHGRDVAVPSEGNEGEPWSHAWNEHQNNQVPSEDRMVVIYGHDARAGLNVEMEVQVADKRPETEQKRRKEEEEREKARKGWFSWWSKQDDAEAQRTRPGTRYAFGLDSGCVYGKQLTALILEAGLEDEHGIVHKVVQVNCEKATEGKDKEKGKGK